MTDARIGVSSGSKAATHHENRDKTKLDYPAGFAFMSKGEKIKFYEREMDDYRKLISRYENELKKIILLERDLYQNQVIINNQKREIIDLYDRLNKDKEHNAIMVAG